MKKLKAAGIVILVAIIIVPVFLWGGNAPGLRNGEEENAYQPYGVTEEIRDLSSGEGIGKCIISVRCDAVFLNKDFAEESLIESLPQNGIILSPVKVDIKEGESAFDILERTLRDQNIHMEFTATPMYKSAYIEGIANLYEFDCGELSGWMYKVNGSFHDYGSSLYEVKNGDVIEWLYTCDRGKDAGKGVK